MVLAGNSADISIMDTVEVPFMLNRDKNGDFVYIESMAKPLNILQNAGLSEDALNPDANYAVGYQDSWVGGFGQEFYNAGEGRRYLSSYGCDLSEDGIAKTGPLWTAKVYPTVTAYTGPSNLDFETWAGATLSTWTITSSGGGTGTCTKNTNATYIKSGSASALLESAGGTDDVLLEQSISAWNNEYRGKRFSATLWVWPVVAGFTLSIYDGVGTTTSSTTGTGAWEALDVSRILNVAATECTVKVYCNVTGSGYVDLCAFSGYAKDTNTKAIKMGNIEYIACGDILFGSLYGSALGYLDNYGAPITDLVVGDVSGTQYLFICTQASTTSATDAIHQKFWYYNPTTQTSTQASGTSATGDYMAVVSSTFYLADTPNTVRTQTNPLTGNFSTAYTIGSATRNITDLVVAGGVCYVIKEDGIYHITAAGVVVEDAPALQGYFSSGAGRNSCEHNGDIFIPMGTSLIFYDVSANTWDNISPVRMVASRGPVDTTASGYSVSAMMLRTQADFNGNIIAVASSPDYLWALQASTGGKIMLYKAQFAVVDGTAAWRWHPIANTTISVTAGGIHGFSYGVTSSVAHVWVGNQTGTPGYYDLTKYQTGAGPYFVTPWYTGGVRHIQKAIYNLTLGLQTISNAHYYVTVTYQKYGDTSWTTYGTYDTTVTTGEQSIYAPANFNSVAVRFKIAMQTDSSSSTPQVNYLKANGKIRNTEIPVIQCSVILSDHGRTRRGTGDGFRATRKLTAINNALASNWPVTAYDPDGTSMTIDMISRTKHGPYFEGNNKWWTVDVIMQKVTLS